MRALVSAVLLGHRDPWELAEFKAFREGFNLNLGDISLFQVPSMTDVNVI
jgi:hypothetical protein